MAKSGFLVPEQSLEQGLEVTKWPKQLPWPNTVCPHFNCQVKPIGQLDRGGRRTETGFGTGFGPFCAFFDPFPPSLVPGAIFELRDDQISVPMGA